jgi:hypothetical protein
MPFALAAFALLAVAAPEKRESLAFLPLAAHAVAEAPRAGVDSRLRAALATAAVAELQTLEETADFLASMRDLGLACDPANVECIVRVGALDAVDVVVTGYLSPTDGGFLLDLVAVSVTATSVQNRIQLRLGNTDAELDRDVRAASIALLRPSAYKAGSSSRRSSAGHRCTSMICRAASRRCGDPSSCAPGPTSCSWASRAFGRFVRTSRSFSKRRSP